MLYSVQGEHVKPGKVFIIIHLKSVHIVMTSKLGCDDFICNIVNVIRLMYEYIVIKQWIEKNGHDNNMKMVQEKIVHSKLKLSEVMINMNDL